MITQVLFARFHTLSSSSNKGGCPFSVLTRSCQKIAYALAADDFEGPFGHRH